MTRTRTATKFARIYVRNMHVDYIWDGALTRANIQGAIRQFDSLLSELLTERIRMFNARIRSSL